MGNCTLPPDSTADMARSIKRSRDRLETSLQSPTASSQHACMHACSSPMCCPHVGARRCREGSVLLGRMAQATNPYKKPTTLPRIPLLHRYRPTDFSFPACPAHEQRLETSSRLVVLILCAGRLFGLGRDCTILLPTPIYTRFNPVECYHTMLANYLMLKKNCRKLAQRTIVDGED